MNIYDLWGFEINWKWWGLFNNSFGIIDFLYKRNDIRFFLYKEYKINFRWIKDFNKKVEF